MKRRNLFLAALLTAIVFVLPHNAPAAIVGIEGLAVEVQGITPPSTSFTTTDPNGWFSVTILTAGDYTLLVGIPSIPDPSVPDPLSSPFATLEFTVDPLKVAPTAILWGRVSTDDELAASLIVSADVIGEDEIGVFAIKMKKKWNSNYSHSNGKIKVSVRGMMADAVTNVTLESAIGSIVADSIKYDPDGNKVKANFTKQTAYQALIPPDTDMIEVTITVDTIAGPQVEVVMVKILGKK
jgi:hypothetical protein